MQLRSGNWITILVACLGVLAFSALLGFGFAFGRFLEIAGGFVGLGLTWAVAAWVNSSFRVAESQLQDGRTRIAALEVDVVHQRDALDELADGLDVMIFLTDTRNRILYANERAIRHFNFDDPEGKSLMGVTLSGDIVDLVQEASETGQPQRAEITLHHPEERIAIVQAWKETSGERMFVTLYDISGLRRLERIRRDFVANVSHELRTPLTTIRAMAETIGDDPDDKVTTLKYVGEILKEVDRLTRITSDLLTLSAAESAKKVERSLVDLNALAGVVVSQLSRKAKEKNLDLIFEAQEIPEVQANEGQMTQLLLNLVDNAINYTQEGSVTLAIEEVDGQVRITVTDTGIGIAHEHQPRIFERFYRVDKARSRSTGGTGLGLSIVRNVAEAHGGRVSITSELGRGSVFTVDLPKA